MCPGYQFIVCMGFTSETVDNSFFAADIGAKRNSAAFCSGGKAPQYLRKIDIKSASFPVWVGRPFQKKENLDYLVTMRSLIFAALPVLSRR